MLPYSPRLKRLARGLRNRSTMAEVLLWNKLKRRQLAGYQFLRQKPIGSYIVDFFCPALRLVIEVDGSSHLTKVAADRERQEKLENLGLHVVRIGDAEVKRDIDAVVRRVACEIGRIERMNGNAGRDNPPSPFAKGDQ
jgi:very-short-patch-repair endonuclease